MPAISGRRAILITYFNAKPKFIGTKIYTIMLINNTNNMKLVPHLGWIVENFIALFTVSGLFAS